ncbi:hypothetical protein MLD38_019815 [Melastoma candidum]|uniref:Uncharacterized protein n=1 Tax=Melastoma candidum TaxID=119954 RepID=A0ACB9QDY5_9MYRT|nr:hypothetical protein MLD38_019815 [Melastoma candidum]
MEKEAPAFLDRTSRATRGKRIKKLLDDEIEEDDIFWNQDALMEEEDDDNYQEEPELADVFDSDFDEDETEPHEEAAAEDPDVRERPKKRLIFPGKPAKKKEKKKKEKDLLKLERSPRDDKPSLESARTDAREDAEVERTVRKSTRTAVIVRQAERDAIRAALQATIKPIKKKKEGEEKRMTQEEMLLEAAQTEIMNLRNLERVLAREEEVKKRAIVHKAVYTGPQVRYISKDGVSFLEFTKGASFVSEIPTGPVTYPNQAVCTVTGLPARYQDPMTGLPYATKEAFKIIRQRCLTESGCLRKEGKMGTLGESLCGIGFSVRQKRTTLGISKEKSANTRHFARYRTIPAVEIDSSE